ncbi:triple tyrosine motif-containing protein [Bacillus sp. CECT 9360]|uniref:triple tyrosine motif-containing protein n=1 Tax=Bacillus sp. CECT 9360 TaxID=2845821 RepID=UPI0025B6A491|nr:triple tyrosine motif-containing protein [Bacillus sp. CECT 9360]
MNAGASTGYSPSFNYSVYDGKKWSTIKNYSASKSVQWKPTKPGTYKLKVEVKSKHSKNTFDDQKIINYNIYEAASMKSVKTDKASPQLKNTNISVSAISNNNANNLFQYSYSTDGKKWTTIKKYSSAAKVNWKPAAPGQYKIKVQVKHKWSKKVFDHEQTISYNIYDEAVLTSFTTDKDKESTQPVHTDITFFANSTNNANNLFEYSYSTDGGEKWTTIKNYSTSTEINWKPDTPGKYKIRVQIKHKLSNKIQGTLDIDFNILSLAELTGDTSVTGRLERNAQVEITANGTEEDGTG